MTDSSPFLINIISYLLAGLLTDKYHSNDGHKDKTVYGCLRAKTVMTLLLKCTVVTRVLCPATEIRADTL